MEAPTPRPHLRGGEVVLIIITLPALLGAAWVGVLHHNAGRSLQAVQWAVDRTQRPPGRPIFLFGTLAGGVLWVAFAFMAGPAFRVELLTSPTMWVIVLLPELAWVVGWLVAVPLLPVCGAGGVSDYDGADAGPARQHAFR